MLFCFNLYCIFKCAKLSKFAKLFALYHENLNPIFIYTRRLSRRRAN